VVDIISHVFDCYVSGADDCSVQDGIAEGIINTVLEWGPVAYDDGSDLRARRELLYASTLAISEFTLAGRAGSWLMHNIEHAISAYYPELPHGRGMAIVMPRVLRYLQPHINSRLARLGSNCFSVPGADEIVLANGMIEQFTRWLGQLDRDMTLADAGVDSSRFDSMADDIIRNDGDGRVYHSAIDLDKDAILEILHSCQA
jgi:alcohol dehydrogenase YqhD (iron-dependent ADH family)